MFSHIYNILHNQMIAISARLDSVEFSVFAAMLCTSILPLKRGHGQAIKNFCMLCVDSVQNHPEILDLPLLCFILTFPNLVTNFETLLLLLHWLEQLSNTSYLDKEMVPWWTKVYLLQSWMVRLSQSCTCYGPKHTSQSHP